jgi:hypothetical protein
MFRNCIKSKVQKKNLKKIFPIFITVITWRFTRSRVCWHQYLEEQAYFLHAFSGLHLAFCNDMNFNPLTPNDPYRGRNAPITYKVEFYIFLK